MGFDFDRNDNREEASERLARDLEKRYKSGEITMIQYQDEADRHNRANDPRRRDPETDTTDPQIDTDDYSDQGDVFEQSLQVGSLLKPIAIVTGDKCREILQNA